MEPLTLLPNLIVTPPPSSTRIRPYACRFDASTRPHAPTRSNSDTLDAFSATTRASIPDPPEGGGGVGVGVGVVVVAEATSLSKDATTRPRRPASDPSAAHNARPAAPPPTTATSTTRGTRIAPIFSPHPHRSILA